MIYLDANATTPVLPEVEQAMRPFFTEGFGNPSSAHAAGRRARRALEDARERIAALLGAFPDEVIFTSGATEANNLALFGLAGEPPGHIRASPIEHPCVIEPLRQLATRGFTVEWMPVEQDGVIGTEVPASGGRKPPVEGSTQPRLVTVMLVNHETGAIQPVRELRSLFATRHMSLFHTDAAQAVGKIPVDFHDLGVDALTASGHKFHAPKGIGLLLLRRGVPVRAQLFGGHQQQGRRPGTEPVALTVGLAAALELCQRRMAEAMDQVRQLRHRLLGCLRTEIPPVVVNGPEDERQSPYALNVSFPGCRAELLLMKLDLAGVACSTGSACSSGSLLPSPVLQAMGVPDEVLRSAMRFSFSPLVTEADIEEAARRIIQCVKDLRQSAEYS